MILFKCTNLLNMLPCIIVRYFTMDTVVITQLYNLNLSNLKTNELKNRYIHVRWKDAKQDIQEIKQDIEILNELSTKTKQHSRDLFCEFGYDTFLEY